VESQEEKDAQKRERVERLIRQNYPDIGEIDPGDSAADLARKARASLPTSIKLQGWFYVLILSLGAVLLIQSRPADQRVVGYWVAGSTIGIIAILVVVSLVRYNIKAKRAREKTGGAA
jgi:hypothetical protein